MLKIQPKIWLFTAALLLNYSLAAQETQGQSTQSQSAQDQSTQSQSTQDQSTQSQSVDAKKIFETIEQKHAGYKALRASGEMVLTDSNNRKSTRRLESELLEAGEEKVFSMLTFIAPNELSGTKLLTHYQKLATDKQWLYLPALKRTRKIVGSTKTNSFLGSELTYEDLTEISASDFRYEWVRQDNCESLISSDTQKCEIIDRYPIAQNSGYSKIRTYVDTTDYHIHKSIYYDHNDREIKTLHVMSYDLIDGRVNRISAMNMTNNINQRQTVLTWTNIEIDESISASRFEERRLKQ